MYSARLRRNMKLCYINLLLTLKRSSCPMSILVLVDCLCFLLTDFMISLCLMDFLHKTSQLLVTLKRWC